MPLMLNPVETERPKQLMWDPTNKEEADEMGATISTLTALGYDGPVDLAEGVAVLVPPALNGSQFVFRVLSENGDDRLVWDRRSTQQVAEARQTFKEYIDKGYKAYVVRRCGGKLGVEVESFDEVYEEVVMAKNKEALLVPPVVPG